MPKDNSALSITSIAKSQLPSVNSDLIEKTQSEFVVDLSFVKGHLLETLDYIEGQIGIIDEKTKSVARFSRNIFETKKLFIEQKLSLLKQLSSLAVDKKRHGDDSNDSMPNITDILNS